MIDAEATCQPIHPQARTVEDLREILDRRLFGTYSDAALAVRLRDAHGIKTWDELIERAYGVVDEDVA